jgi:hypothetical protein
VVINIFLSIILTGFSVFWALRNFRTPDFFTLSSVSPSASSGSGEEKGSGGYPGNPSPSKDALFVLISIAVGIVVGIAEVVVYVGYLRRVKEAKRRERTKKERKEIISSNHLSESHRGDEGEDGNEEEQPEQKQDQDKEEIWGKGTNGGLRRRVREKWEKSKEEGK